MASTNISLPNIAKDIFAGETKLIESPSKTKYYIVAGAFKKESNAKILADKLKEKGYYPKVLNTENGFFRVTYIEEQDSNKADADLHKIKTSENQSAWLLKW